MRVVRSPSPDDIFRAWVERLEDKEYRDLFVPKNANIPRSKVSSAENVESVDKSVFVLIVINARSRGKLETKIVTVDKLSKIEFYDYPTIKPVPIFKSITKVRCKDCNGMGTVTCRRCGGTGKIKCPKCGGRGYLKCDYCGGTGKIEITVKVRVDANKTEKRKIEVTCPKCHGTGRIHCDRCGGTGYIICPECHGSGKLTCKTCGGYGHLIRFDIGPTITEEKTYRYIAPKELVDQKYFKKILSKLASAEPIVMNSLDDLNKENIIQLLGYEPENLQQIRKELKEILEPLQKGKLLSNYTIKLYPMIRLNIKTTKNKKAIIVGVGTAQKYTIVRIK